MGLPKLVNLVRIAGVGGILVAGGSYYFKKRIEAGIRSSEYYKKTFDILKSNSAIVHYIGLPILEGSLNLGEPKNNYCTGTEAKFEF